MQQIDVSQASQIVCMIETISDGIDHSFDFIDDAAEVNLEQLVEAAATEINEGNKGL